MPNSDRTLDDKTGLPRRMSLADVFNDIKLSPFEISALLSEWASAFYGGANHNLGQALRDHANLVTDPRTFGYKAPENPTPPGVEPYSAPTPDQVSYADVYGNAPRPPSTPAPATSVEPSPSPTGAPQFDPLAQDAPLSATRREPTTGEPEWLAQARAAGWSAPGEAPREFRQPADQPPVTPAYRAPFTVRAPGEGETSPTTPPQPTPPPAV